MYFFEGGQYSEEETKRGGEQGGGVKRIIELIFTNKRNKKVRFLWILFSKRLPQQAKKREKKEFIVYIL